MMTLSVIVLTWAAFGVGVVAAGVWMKLHNDRIVSEHRLQPRVRTTVTMANASVKPMANNRNTRIISERPFVIGLD